MTKYSDEEIKNKSGMAKKVVAHHFGNAVYNIEFKPAGKTNFVFDVKGKEGNFIVRIAGSPHKIDNFRKEQWVAQKAGEKGIPVPEILEVGNEIISLPYMLQKKIDGNEAMDHPDRLDILHKLGNCARLIHSIATSGFGSVFDWSDNQSSKNETWPDFLDKELKVSDRLNFLREHNFLSGKKLTKLVNHFDEIRKWNIAPCLNHCDLRLKNVIVNDEGKILAIIDWENCSSNIAPYWDFSIALHDLSIDGKQKFLEGYSLDFQQFDRMSYALTAFNLINYIPSLKRILEKKDHARLELYKLRLNGSFDLFSL